MDGKPRNHLVGNIIAGALISGSAGFLIAIFMHEPWQSHIGMIIGFAIGGACCAFIFVGGAE